jgi:hypothetical protein
MACEACQSDVAAGELQLSGAGQWLCRSCLARYAVEVGNRRAHELQVYRRCNCGLEIAPEDVGDVPLYRGGDYEIGYGRHGVNLGYAFRSTVYHCACGRRFKIPHPALAVLGVLVTVMVVVANRIAQVPSRIKFFGKVSYRFLMPAGPLFVVALGIVVALAAPQLYYRWRYPRSR